MIRESTDGCQPGVGMREGALRAVVSGIARETLSVEGIGVAGSSLTSGGGASPKRTSTLVGTGDPLSEEASARIRKKECERK